MADTTAVDPAPKDMADSRVNPPAYRSPLVQVILIGLVCFLCPVMFNALSGLGAAGQVDGKVHSNASVYTTFAFFGFVSGTILNRFGARATLAFAGLGCALYSASFL